MAPLRTFREDFSLRLCMRTLVSFNLSVNHVGAAPSCDQRCFRSLRLISRPFARIHLQILESPEETKIPPISRDAIQQPPSYFARLCRLVRRLSGLTLVAEGTPGAGRGAQDTEDPVEQWTEAHLSVFRKRTTTRVLNVAGHERLGE